MVRVGAFKVELVDATTKVPFKERTKDGRTYVEAEPDAEYFVSIQKDEKTDTNVAISYSVDEQEIRGSTIIRKDVIMREPDYKGIRSLVGGISSHASLVFAKPTISHKPAGSLSNLQMGRVEIKVYEVRFMEGFEKRRGDVVTKFKVASVNLDASGASKKKNLRSGKGSAIISRERSETSRKTKLGAHRDTSKCRCKHFQDSTLRQQEQLCVLGVLCDS